METTHQLEEAQHLQPKLGLLDDPSRLWQVRKGAVDLFLVRVQNGLPAGARRPLTRVGAGEVLFGLSVSDGLTLLGQPTPGTRVVPADWNSLTEDDIAHWIERLAAPLGVMPPASLIGLGDGHEVELPPGAACGGASLVFAPCDKKTRLHGLTRSRPAALHRLRPCRSSPGVVAPGAVGKAAPPYGTHVRKNVASNSARIAGTSPVSGSSHTSPE